ncbi:serine/threonine-protein kinase [Nocardia nova SH22a]|uniref:non-specific serine/threonine protein kinase n=1 Tax=Nocardia nova SH22a TaxID=1415166 RepID=W5TAF8_9NOCA|nr:serine/threonine-protein kinase [Nocardia nova]AHH15958.1 serine/threonine-protein kinase [Nocardia nova SH22a]
MSPRQFGRYRLDRLLGRGSAGEVWLAYDSADARTVALKILSGSAAEDADYRRRFEREARIGARLDNPHIAAIHHFGEFGGRLYLDMAYIPGVDLAKLVRSSAMTAEEAVDLVSQVAEALDAAHAAGLVHRDVKPANIIVHTSGFAYLIDFGIARVEGQTTITATGFTVGTLAYMAPERFTGRGDARSDVYSLACVLYECLTAQRPFGDTDAVQQLHAHLHQPPPRPSTEDPAIPVALDGVIARGMAKQPGDRFRTAGELAEAACAAITVTARPVRTSPLPDPGDPTVPHPPRTPRPTLILPAPTGYPLSESDEHHPDATPPHGPNPFRPSTSRPAAALPGASGPASTSHANAAPPGTPRPDTASPGTSRLGAGSPDPSRLGTAAPGTPRAGTTSTSTSQPGTSRFDTAAPGTPRSGAVPTSTSRFDTDTQTGTPGRGVASAEASRPDVAGPGMARGVASGSGLRRPSGTVVAALIGAALVIFAGVAGCTALLGNGIYVHTPTAPITNGPAVTTQPKATAVPATPQPQYSTAVVPPPWTIPIPTNIIPPIQIPRPANGASGRHPAARKRNDHPANRPLARALHPVPGADPTHITDKPPRAYP